MYDNDCTSALVAFLAGTAEILHDYKIFIVNRSTLVFVSSGTGRFHFGTSLGLEDLRMNHAQVIC
jgi:hypothetical protein